MQRKCFLFSLLGIVLVLWACARVGSPSGGDKDQLPPTILRTDPPSGTTNFQGKRIRLYFDELVSIRDVRRQLIISPPMEIFPEIHPTTHAARMLELKILDTLRPNTTYIISFGKSIQDNNEGNPLPFYSYVFSTGPTLDSLSLTGTIADSYKVKINYPVSVMLYEVGANYTDSLVYKQKPTYLTTTSDSLHSFSLTHLRTGKYRLVALQEKTPNYIFSPKEDAIGFYEHFITLPSDSTYHLRIFRQNSTQRTARPFVSSAHRVSIGYEGVRDSVQVLFPTDLLAISQEKEKDTLHLWLPPAKYDSLKVVVRNVKVDTFGVKFRQQKPDSLQVSLQSEPSTPTDGLLSLQSNIPIKVFRPEQLLVHLVQEQKLTEQLPASSFSVKSEQDATLWKIHLRTQPNKKYDVLLLPKALTDIYGNSTDTLKVSFTSPSADSFAHLRLRPTKEFRYPIIVELLSEQQVVQYSQVLSEKKPQWEFPYVRPGKYLVRVVEDTNANNKWDTGNFLLRQQPEGVFFLPQTIELRANWEVEETF